MFDIDKTRTKGIDEEIVAILVQINANERKIESCKHHDFSLDRNKFGKFVCKKCGCEVSGAFVSGYKQGLKHGKQA